jgi:hypothetical protein
MATLSSSKRTCVVVLLVCLCASPSVLFLLLGQDTIPTLVVANHSAQDLMLIGDEETRIPSGKVVEAPWPTSNKIFHFRTDNDEEWTYKWIPTRSPYYQHRQYYIQIEADMTLYALPYHVLVPVESLPSQPDNYPLVPEEKKKKSRKK